MLDFVGDSASWDQKKLVNKCPLTGIHKDVLGFLKCIDTSTY